MDYKYICIECRNTFEPEFNKLKCTSGNCEYLDTSCFDIIFEENDLPIEFEAYSLGEGNTPSVNISDKFPEVLSANLKLEYFSPTGSFKDRGTSVLIKQAYINGVEEFAEDSSGNAGASMSAYAANIGMKAHIFTPNSTPENKKNQIKIFGSELHLIDGPRENSTIEVKKFTELTGINYLSHNYNPFFIEGMKSFGYEVFNEFHADITDIIIPVGNGSLLIGAVKAYEELIKLKKISKMPKMHCIQVEGFSPIVKKFNSLEWKFNEFSKTLAGGIAVSNPPRLNQVIESIRNSNGKAIEVSEANILNWHKELASWGFLSEITCAAALAGTEKLIESGVINEKSNIVIPITGSGLKDLDKVNF